MYVKMTGIRPFRPLREFLPGLEMGWWGGQGALWEIGNLNFSKLNLSLLFRGNHTIFIIVKYIIIP